MRLRLIASVLAAVALVAGCGGDGGEVPPSAIAVVDGHEIPKAEFDELMATAKRNYKQSKREFPKAGTPEYQAVKNNAVQFLVEGLYFQLGAEDLGITVANADVEKAVADLKKNQFKGNEKRYQAALEQAGMDESDLAERLRTQLVQQRIAAKLTGGVEVKGEEIERYYREHKSEYRTPASREVRHILLSVCGGPQADPKECQPAGAAKRLARQIRARLVAGESFAKLAKRYSDDPGSKASGGKLTAVKGQTVPEFDKTSFTLAKGALSQPVKTDFGYHLIEALSRVKPAKTSPLAQVRSQIRSQLASEKSSEALRKWVEETKEEYGEKTDYQAGFAPPPTS